MVICTEKSKVMVNSNDNSIHANITLYGEKLEEVDKFGYLGSTLRDGSCEADIRIRLAKQSCEERLKVLEFEDAPNKNG